MYCMHCGSEISENATFCSNCGQSIRAVDATPVGSVADVAKNAVSNVADKLNEMAGGSGHVELKFGDFFKEAIKKHSSEESEELFICGTPSTTPSLKDVSTTWPRPWLWSRVLISLTVVFIGLIIMWKSFNNANAIPGAIVIGSFMVPIATMVLFFETNAPRNISFVRTLKVFFVGGVLSLIATLAFGNVVQGAGTGDLWPAMLTGLIEEAGKIAAIVFFMSRTKGRNYILNGLLIGAAVGAGFAAFESSGYAFRFLVYSILDQLGNLDIQTLVSVLTNPLGYGDRVAMLGYSTTMDIIVSRGILAIGGHVAWAAVEGAVLASCEDESGFKLGQLANPVFVGFAVGMIALHGIWDTSISYLDTYLFMSITPKFTLLTIAVWIVLAVMLNRGLAQVNELANAEEGQFGENHDEAIVTTTNGND